MTPHEVLGVPPAATTAEIKAAYRRLCKERHPDTGGSVEAFRALNEAYKALCGGNAKLTPSETAQLKRELYAVTQKLAVVEATIVTWSKDDYRIPQMRDPLLKEKARIEAALKSS